MIADFLVLVMAVGLALVVIGALACGAKALWLDLKYIFPVRRAKRQRAKAELARSLAEKPRYLPTVWLVTMNYSPNFSAVTIVRHNAHND